MATTNEQMIEHLSEKQRVAVEAADGVHEYVLNSGKYRAAEATRLMNDVKALHPNCSICATWDGTAS